MRPCFVNVAANIIDHGINSLKMYVCAQVGGDLQCFWLPVTSICPSIIPWWVRQGIHPRQGTHTQTIHSHTLLRAVYAQFPLCGTGSTQLDLQTPHRPSCCETESLHQSTVSPCPSYAYLLFVMPPNIICKALAIPLQITGSMSSIAWQPSRSHSFIRI